LSVNEGLLVAKTVLLSGGKDKNEKGLTDYGFL
jgi:hypothetical protein